MVYERDYRGLPERRDLIQRPSFWQDENKKNTKRYILYRNQEEFYKAYDTEEYRQSLNYKSLELLRAPILASGLRQTKTPLMTGITEKEIH